MAFVKILAPLTGGSTDEAVLAGAVAAALPTGARVAALFVRPDPALSMPFYGESVSSVVVQEVVDQAKEVSDKAEKVACAAVGKVGETGARIDYARATGNLADCVSQAARLCDLVVFLVPKDEERTGLTEAIEAVLLEARRPALISCRAIVPGFQERVAIGWNASVESALAVSAALPYLTRAKSVDILAAEQPGTPCADCAELTEYLSLHGVAAQTREVKAGARPIAEVLFEAAAEAGAGLLVLGGYSHSRWRELFVSGVTRQAIARADLPLFLVH